MTTRRASSDTTRRLLLELELADHEALTGEARRRGLTLQELVENLLREILASNLFTVVLDEDDDDEETEQ